MNTLAGSGQSPRPPAFVLPRFTQAARVYALGNGMTVCLLPIHHVPVVSTALFYRAGTRDEPSGQGGIAHFLEHMMFKGSQNYATGEIDRRTQALGGSNNAFTSHDLTGYYFDFAADRWQEALAIEADRMSGLTLDPREVASERQVILEEIAMYDGEPWDALELAVHRELFAGRAYGRPVLGTRDELAAIGATELGSFHRRYYQPGNAILVVAGDLDGSAEAAVSAAFGSLAGQAPPPRPLDPSFEAPRGLHRIERRHGDVTRFLLALPAPAGSAPDHAGLRLLSTLLAGGRASRLQRALVDEGQLCAWVSMDLSAGLEPGHLSIAAELVPGVSPQAVEEVVLAELVRLRSAEPSTEELARARQITLADWVFNHERVHHRAMALGSALTLFDREYEERQLERLLVIAASELPELAGRYLDAERGAVLGLSFPSERPTAGEAAA